MRSGKVPKWKQKMNQEVPSNEKSRQTNGGNALDKKIANGERDANGNLISDQQIEQKQFSLQIHTLAHSNEEIMLNQDIFSDYLRVAGGESNFIEIHIQCLQTPCKCGQVIILKVNP